MKLIDKAAVVAEINKRLHQLTDAAFDSMIGRNLIEIKDFLDTLEVKEVDLESEVEKCLKKYQMLAVGKKDFTSIAKHFFELGMQVSNKAQNGE